MDLDDLHARVPAAQEEDLLEEVARERAAAERAAYDAELARVGDLLTGELGELGEEAPGTAAESDSWDEPPLRFGQVLGLVEHVLGAVVLDVHRPAPRPGTVGPPRDDVR